MDYRFRFRQSSKNRLVSAIFHLIKIDPIEHLKNLLCETWQSTNLPLLGLRVVHVILELFEKLS